MDLHMLTFLLLALINSSHQVQITMSNPLFQGDPTQQIWQFVPPGTHCCAPLDLEFEGKQGWWRAESVTFQDLPPKKPTFVHGYGLAQGHASCQGKPMLSITTSKPMYRSQMFPPFAALGGAAYQIGRGLETFQPTKMVYPDFVVHKKVFYEKVHEEQGVLIYESLAGGEIIGRSLFPVNGLLNNTVSDTV